MAKEPNPPPSQRRGLFKDKLATIKKPPPPPPKKKD